MKNRLTARGQVFINGKFIGECTEFELSEELCYPNGVRSLTGIYDVKIKMPEKVQEVMVVTLCGSTKFKKEFEEANKKLTLEGHIVLSVGLFGHADNEPITDDQKEMLDELHKRKIDLSDAIFVINVNGYIGSSTKSEIEYALKTGKRVIYLEDHQEIDWSRVKLDTPILVSDFKNDKFSPRYFASYRNGQVYAWKDGRTSISCDKTTTWKFVKLPDGVKPEDVYVDARKVERPVNDPLIVKPPLGLTPRHIRECQRIGEILEAMQRYNEAGKPIPAAWVEELRDLNQRQHEVKVQGSVIQTIIDEIENALFVGGGV